MPWTDPAMYPGDPTQFRDRLVAEFDAIAATQTPARPSRTAPASVPVLADLPLVTSGPHKGEWWMTPVEFAAWCGEPIATIRDRIYERHVEVQKLGTTRNARLRIASGERERMWARIGQQTRRAVARP